MESVGRVHPHVEAKVVRDDGETAQFGEIGELWVKGYLVMKGYWNQADKTREAMHQGWMKTGDLATIDSEGFCAIVGRKKDLVIRCACACFNVFACVLIDAEAVRTFILEK